MEVEFIQEDKKMNIVHNLDCMEFMKEIPDKYYDLAICDPPYGIGEDGGKNNSRGCLAKTTKFISKLWDRQKPTKEYFIELFRISKNQIIWGGNYFIENLYSTSCFIIWDKDNGNTDFADCEVAWTSFKTAIRKFKFKYQGMLQEDMKNKDIRIHPTQKPVALYKWLLQNYAKSNDKIFDSHVGSGSSRCACYELGFDFEGCEFDKDYWQAQEERFRIFKNKIDHKYYLPDYENKLFKEFI
jgi:site-specific DNA-methyltransferase (adenine-specific)